MKKKEIVRILAYCVYGIIEVVALLFFAVATYFVLCLMA